MTTIGAARPIRRLVASPSRVVIPRSVRGRSVHRVLTFGHSRLGWHRSRSMGGPLHGLRTAEGATRATPSPAGRPRPMSHLLIPGPAGGDRATMWLAAIDEATDARTLEVVAASGARATVGAWEPAVRGGDREVRYARVELTGLAERSRQWVELRQGATVLATATATTLPRALPGIGDRPFTILLGSCF